MTDKSETAREAFKRWQNRGEAFYELISEAVDAEGHRCAECGDTAPGDKLLVFYSVRGARRREHDGVFCSESCHDRWYGLRYPK